MSLLVYIHRHTVTQCTCHSIRAWCFALCVCVCARACERLMCISLATHRPFHSRHMCMQCYGGGLPRHIEALSEWDDFVKGRQSERKMTYRPNPNAKGRRKTTPGERHKSGYFTLSKLMLTRKSGGDASSATSASEPAPPANRPSDAAHKPTEI